MDIDIYSQRLAFIDKHRHILRCLDNINNEQWKIDICGHTYLI